MPNWLGRMLLGVKKGESMEEWRRRKALEEEVSEEEKKYMKWLGTPAIRRTNTTTKAWIRKKWRRVPSLQKWLEREQ